MQKSIPYLGIAHHVVEEESTGTHFELKREFSEVEYQEYREACKALARVKNFSFHLLVVWGNYQHYHTLLSEAIEARTKDDHFNVSLWDLNINRAFLNFLSSVTMYLNATHVSLKRYYGESSEAVTKFEQIRQQCYSTHFAYRFLYQLRNYAQHYGLPLDNITWDAKRKPIRTEPWHYTLLVGINRDALLATGFNWKKLAKEIAAQPPIIEINQQIVVLIHCLEQINQFVTREAFSHLNDSAILVDRLLKVIDYIPGRTGGFPITLELQIIDEDSNKIVFDNLQNVPVEIVNAVLANKFEDLLRKI